MLFVQYTYIVHCCIFISLFLLELCTALTEMAEVCTTWSSCEARLEEGIKKVGGAFEANASALNNLVRNRENIILLACIVIIKFRLYLTIWLFVNMATVK